MVGGSKLMKGYLLLEDGTKYSGELFGYLENSVGEVVFNTSMTGYQEIVTDPSYFNQIVVMSYPLIGNYGIFLKLNQSSKIHIKGLVVREISDIYAHHNGEMSLKEFFLENKITGISDVDTRAIVKKIRDNGTLKGIIVNDEIDEQYAFVEMGKTKFKDYVKSVTTKNSYELYPESEIKYKVAVLDFGIKKNILNELLKRNVQIKVFPAFSKVSDILNYNPDGIFLSNGPGDPKEVKEIIENIKLLINKEIPMFGICLGHQLISLACGGDTKKLKYGHRGGNHPVKDLSLNKIMITAQNHGYVVDEESLKGLDVEITHINLNDGSIEGIKHTKKPVFTVQYHPEASPGPKDSNYLFDDFIKLIKKSKGVKNNEKIK